MVAEYDAESLNEEDQLEQKHLFKKMMQSVKSYDEEFYTKTPDGEQPYPKLLDHPSLQFLMSACCPTRKKGLWNLWNSPNPNLTPARQRKRRNVPEDKKTILDEQKMTIKDKLDQSLDDLVEPQEVHLAPAKPFKAVTDVPRLNRCTKVEGS